MDLLSSSPQNPSIPKASLILSLKIIFFPQQEEFVLRLKSENVLELLLSMAGSMDETEYSEYNTLILEIFYLIFLGRAPEELAPKDQPRLSLFSAAQKDAKKKAITDRIMTRHSRFGGTVTLQFKVSFPFSLLLLPFHPSSLPFFSNTNVLTTQIHFPHCYRMEKSLMSISKMHP